MQQSDAVGVFLVEARELFDQLEHDLLDLEGRLDDGELIDSVFRGLHTLKGSGAMFGFSALAEFTHHCETAFDRVRKSEASATVDLVSAILAALDHMRALISAPDGDHAQESESLLAALGQSVSGGEPARQGAQAERVEPARATWDIRFTLPPNALVNGINPLGLLAELRDLGPCEVVCLTDNLPPLDALDPVQCHLSWRVTLTTDQPRSAIEEVFIFVMDEMELEIGRADSAGSEPGASNTAEAASTTESDPPAASNGGEDRSPTRGQPAADGRGGESVRVPAGRLDQLMDQVGELVIAQSRLSQLAGRHLDLRLRSVSEEIERLATALRETTMVLRMAPVGSMFGRFRRLVHDLSRETGKAIELVCEGESTEVDKTVAERLVDPLVHLVRNAADHGLESPAERRSAGKPPVGVLRLSARQSGGEVVISVSDDGRGVNRERVRARAEAQGLLEPGAPIGDAELLMMIFHPGFSTAQQVTSLSGRGVGMDVVKRAIESLRGSIDVVSRPGEGSEFALRLPLTLAIIDGLLVRVGHERYVVPLGAIEECLELTLEDDLRSQGHSFICLRDRLVPYMRLRELFDAGTPPELHQKLVVVASGGERVGLVVDQIIGEHQTVVKSLSKLHAAVEAFSGATILGDGGVAMILDIARLVGAGQRREAQMRAVG